MNAPPFPISPSVGQRHGQWVWNGVRWVCGPTTGIQVVLQKFLVSGPYMPSPGLVTAQVEAVGGGGGGGGALGGIAVPGQGLSGWVCGAGGGSGGSYARSMLPAVLVMGGVQVTIGAGGAGGLGSGTPGLGNSGYGQPGGITSFGALVQAPGGWGGGSNIWNPSTPGAIAGGLDPSLGQGADPAIDPPIPGLPQPPIVGDFGGYGGAGMSGGNNFFDPAEMDSGQSIVWGGAGGSTLMSGTWASAKQQAAGQDGRDGHAHGVAGGGGISTYTNAPANGGQGAVGTVLVTEYCWASAGDGEDCMNPPVNVNARVAVTHVPWPGPGPCPPGWGQQQVLDYDGDE